MRHFLDTAGAYVLAVLVHVVLLAVLAFNYQWSRLGGTSAPPPAAEPIEATVLDEEEVRKELEAIQAREEQEQREAEDRLLAAREQRKREEQRREEAAAAREAEEKRREEAAAAREAEEQRREEAVAAREAEERRREEAAAARAAEERRRRDEQRRQEEERLRREAMQREQQRLEEERKAIFARALAEYIGTIQASVTRNWRRPTGIPHGLEVEVHVLQARDGEVLKVEIPQGSGNVAFDRSVMQAVWEASPLPQPGQPSLFDSDIIFLFNPEG